MTEILGMLSPFDIVCLLFTTYSKPLFLRGPTVFYGQGTRSSLLLLPAPRSGVKLPFESLLGVGLLRFVVFLCVSMQSICVDVVIRVGMGASCTCTRVHTRGMARGPCQVSSPMSFYLTCEIGSLTEPGAH